MTADFSVFPLAHEVDIPEERQLAALAASWAHFHANGSPKRPGVSGAGMDTGKLHGPISNDPLEGVQWADGERTVVQWDV